jgi:hypothetical protein
LNAKCIKLSKMNESVGEEKEYKNIIIYLKFELFFL